MEERLKELERTHAEQNSEESLAALLIESMRVGALDRARVEVAAFLGSHVAKRALGVAVLAPDDAGFTSAGCLLEYVEHADHECPLPRCMKAGRETVLRILLAIGRGIYHHNGSMDPAGLEAIRYAATAMVASSAEGLSTMREQLLEEALKADDDIAPWISMVDAAPHGLGVAVQTDLCEGHDIIASIWGSERDLSTDDAWVKDLCEHVSVAGEIILNLLDFQIDEPTLEGKTIEGFVKAANQQVLQDVTPWLLDQSDPLTDLVSPE